MGAVSYFARLPRLLTMWQLLLVSIVVRQVRAGSISGSAEQKFPFDEQATVGQPVAGEGVGGVSVLLKPIPEATTMKTWSFLKESMLKIGDQVAEILAVRRDMAMLQKDLSAQEKLWHQAEIELKEENGKLQAELMRLQMEVKAGANARIELTTAEQALAEEQRRGQDLIDQADLQAREHKMQVQVLTNRKLNLTAFQQKVNETASKEISRAEGVHLQLHKDAATLDAAIDSFMDRISSGRKEMAYEQTKFTSEYAELQRQLAAMNEGKKRIEGKLKPRSIFEDAERALKEQLHQETLVILALQSDYQQIVTECMKMMQQQEQVKCAENAKLTALVQEKTSFCNSVQVQNQVLVQDLNACNLFFNIASPGSREQTSPAVITPAGYASQGFTIGQRVQVKNAGDPNWSYGTVNTLTPLKVLVDGDNMAYEWGIVQPLGAAGFVPSPAAIGQAPAPGQSQVWPQVAVTASYDDAAANRLSVAPSLYNIGR